MPSSLAGGRTSLEEREVQKWWETKSRREETGGVTALVTTPDVQCAYTLEELFESALAAGGSMFLLRSR